MNRGSVAAKSARKSEIIKASMRPRFMNRGSVIVRRIRLVAGRGFNEAPIHESGKFAEAVRSYITDVRLQ